MHRVEQTAPSRLPLVGVLVWVAFTYIGVLQAGFAWDDHRLIEEQDQVRTLAPVVSYFARPFGADALGDTTGFYRPLVTLSDALEYQLWDGSPTGFHLTNLAVHLGVVALVFLLCRRTGASPGVSAVGAALFGVMPRLTESVAWVSGRTDLFAAFFAFAALLLHPAAEGKWRARWGAAGLLLLGLLSKEVALAGAVAIGVLEVLEVLRGRRTPRRALLHLVPSLVALLVYLGLRMHAMGEGARVAVASVRTLPPEQRVGAALAALGHYALMLLDPLRPRLQIGMLGSHPWPLMLLGGAVAVVLALVLWRAAPRLAPLQLAAVVAGGAALGMVLHLVPFSFNFLAADRYLYFPLGMAAVALAGWASSRFTGRAAAGAAVAVLVALSAATFQRCREWSDEYLLWKTEASRAGEDDHFASQQLGLLMMEEARYDRALPYLQRAVRAGSEVAGLGAHNNLALCLARLGRHEEAIALFEEMVRQQPQDRRARLNLVMALARTLRLADAEQQLQEVSARAPDAPEVTELRALLRRVRERTPQLLPAHPGEPASIAVERALLYEELGAPFEAGQSWQTVATAADATPEQQLRATGYLVLQGDVVQARDALAGLRRTQPARPELDLLEEQLVARSRLE